MARLFASADDDIITTGFSTYYSTRSWGIWAYRTGNGGGSKGRMWEHNSVGWLDHESAANGEFFEGNYSTRGYWKIAVPSANVWHHFLVTYDDSSTTNDPVIYLDGASQTVTETNTPSGTVDTTTANYTIGNRAALARGWDGYLAEFAIWNRILTVAEAAMLGDGFSPLFIPNGLVSYCPIIREMIDLKNGTITDGGTAEIAHPRIIYPSPAQIRRFTTAAPSPAALNAYKTLLGVGL